MDLNTVYKFDKFLNANKISIFDKNFLIELIYEYSLMIRYLQNSMIFYY